MAKVKSGRPTLKATVTRGSSSYASRIRTVRVTMPKGLKIKKGDALEIKLAVKAGGPLPITQLIVKSGLLTVTTSPAAR